MKKKMKKKMKENKIKLCSGKAAGNAGSVDYEQDYLSNKEIDMDDEDNKINITKVEYDKKHIFNNKVFHRRIKHVRT